MGKKTIPAVPAKRRKSSSTPVVESLSDPLQTTPLTTEERLVHIRGLGERIEGYIKFMSNVGNVVGTSSEAKERAVAAFYEQLAHLEKRLRRIHDDFQLE